MTKPRRYFIGSIEAYLGADGEVELSRRGEDGLTSVSGKGHGNLNALRLAWGIILASARQAGIKKLYCEPTLADGRGKTRIAVYKRAGFKIVSQTQDHAFMECAVL